MAGPRRDSVLAADALADSSLTAWPRLACPRACPPLQDLFYPQLTVKETLMMAAQLRMSADTPAEAREAYVDGIISRLGLAKVRRPAALPNGMARGALPLRVHRNVGLASSRPEWRLLRSTRAAAAHRSPCMLPRASPSRTVHCV